MVFSVPSPALSAETAGLFTTLAGVGSSWMVVALLRLFFVICGLVLPLVAADTAADYARLAREAEKAGKITSAYIYYTQAAALSPDDPSYWLKSEGLRTRALSEMNLVPSGLAEALAAQPGEPDTEADGADLLGHISLADIQEAHQFRMPVELAATEGKKDLDVEGDGRQIWEALGSEFGLTVVFDDSFQPGRSQHIQVTDVDFDDAVHIVMAATSAFPAPLDRRVMLVAADNQQTRAQLEPVMAVTIPLADTVSVQDVQEAAQAVQQTMELRRLVVDTTRRMVFIRDTVSKTRTAVELFDQLVDRRPEVAVQIEFLEAVDSSALSYGMDLQSSFPLVWLGDIPGLLQSPLTTGFRFVTFGGGASVFGLGLANAELFASMSRSSTRTLLRTTVRSVDGQPATLHVGDRYPIIQQGYYGEIQQNDQGDGQVYRPPPTVSFEDLGVEITVTPRVHGADDVTLDVDAEYKVLSGDAVNGIPVIANRSFKGVVRVREGQWALMTGLTTNEEMKSVTGIAGLSGIPVIGPLFSHTTKDKKSTDTLIVLRPRLVSPVRAGHASRAIYTGTESRMVPIL